MAQGTVSVGAKYYAMTCNDYNVNNCPAKCKTAGETNHWSHMGICQQRPLQNVYNSLDAGNKTFVTDNIWAKLECQIVGKTCDNQNDCLAQGECEYGHWQWEFRDVIETYDKGFCTLPYNFTRDSSE
jgi:hypothetical protein